MNRSTERSARIIWHAGCVTAALVVIALSFSMRIEGRAFVYLPGQVFPLPASCMSQWMLGIDCPACGLTRGFISIGQADVTSAWQYNRASPLVYLFVVAQIPWHALQLLRISRKQAPFDYFWPMFMPLGIVLILIFQWLLRLIAF